MKLLKWLDKKDEGSESPGFLNNFAKKEMKGFHIFEVHSEIRFDIDHMAKLTQYKTITIQLKKEL